MKQIRRLFSLLFVFALAGAMLASVSFADTRTQGAFRYGIKEDGTAILLRYDGSLSGDLEIPGTLGGAAVTEIGEGAGGGDRDIVSLTLPESVKTVGARAFSGFSALERARLPETMDAIGFGAFADCPRLTEITLPAGLAAVENALFRNTGLRGIEIPEGVERIGDGAFAGCGALTCVTLPRSLKIVFPDAFLGCGALTSLRYDGTDAQYSAILIFESGNAPLSALKAQDLSVQARTPFVPCRDRVFEVPGGATVRDYYTALTEPFLRPDAPVPYTLTEKIRIRRDLRMAEIDYESYLALTFGDLDHDGEITAGDARDALRMSVALYLPPPVDTVAADVDHDGSVTAADARLILRGSVDLEDPAAWNA